MIANDNTNRLILILQIASISLIWIFVGGIITWILNLLFTAIKLNDTPNGSVGISLVVIPIFVILAGTLTYVFVGLQRYKNDPVEDGVSDIGDHPK